MKTLSLIIISILLTGCCNDPNPKYEGSLIVNETYIRHRSVCEKDPFLIDTVLILALKDDYVRYQIIGSHDNERVGHISSTDQDYFRYGLNPLF